MVDVVTAGFPCPPFSIAGKHLGERDNRNMWPETKETIRQVRPKHVLLENVPGLLAFAYFGTILRDLAEMGYMSKWGVLSACAFGAPHTRERLFIVSNSQGNAKQSSKLPRTPRPKLFKSEHRRGFGEKVSRPYWEKGQPGFSEVVDDVASWMGAVSAYGNGQVPIVVKAVWRLMGPQ